MLYGPVANLRCSCWVGYWAPCMAVACSCPAHSTSSELAMLTCIINYKQHCFSPIKVVKNPDGSMQRAATTQSALAKERREMRDMQAKQELDSIPRDLQRPWEDPLDEPGERYRDLDLLVILILTSRLEH